LQLVSSSNQSRCAHCQPSGAIHSSEKPYYYAPQFTTGLCVATRPRTLPNCRTRVEYICGCVVKHFQSTKGTTLCFVRSRVPSASRTTAAQLMIASTQLIQPSNYWRYCPNNVEFVLCSKPTAQQCSCVAPIACPTSLLGNDSHLYTNATVHTCAQALWLKSWTLPLHACNISMISHMCHSYQSIT
jgi:hypothetical protein